MTELRERYFDWLSRRNYSPRTISSYVGHVKRFALHYDRCPSEISDEELIAYWDYLRVDLGMSQSSLNLAYSS